MPIAAGDDGNQGFTKREAMRIGCEKIEGEDHGVKTHTIVSSFLSEKPRSNQSLTLQLYVFFSVEHA